MYFIKKDHKLTVSRRISNSVFADKLAFPLDTPAHLQ